MGRIKKHAEKIVSWVLAFLMASPFVGTISLSDGGLSTDDIVGFDMTIGSMGSLLEHGARKPIDVRLEAVKDSSLGAVVPRTVEVGNILAEVPSNSGPFPLDAPFGPDILVFNDSNNQTNPSIDRASNDDLYVAFEHSSGPDSDIYISKSSNGGVSWSTSPLVATAANESCPSLTIDYSPSAGTEKWYVFYEADEFEYAWSDDGTTWNRTVIGSTFWSRITCPYVYAYGDFVAVVAQYYDDSPMGQGDTWYILYTLDGFQTTTGYYWTFWDTDIHIYQPKASIMDDDELIVAMDLYDQSDPNPATWWHDAFIMHSVVAGTGNQGDDSWDAWWGSGVYNLDYTSPTIGAYGRQVVFAQEVYNLTSLPQTTHMIICTYTNDYQGATTKWNRCFEDASGWLAFDATVDQKYPQVHREASSVHAVWMNGTDINYRFSPDNGNSWVGDPTTGLPMKVNEPGIGTAADKWHSPDVTVSAGKPGVVWHDTRGNGSIYFQTWANVVLYTIETQPSMWGLWCREVGDAWHPPPYSYLWAAGTQHDIECIPSYEVPNDRWYNFSHWDDGNTSNPHTITVDPADPDIVAIYDAEYYLTMINPGGITIPTSGYQPEDAVLTIEAFSPVAPPGGRYVWLGWTGIGPGSYTGPLNPCVDCVTMNGPITQRANWRLQWKVNFFTQPDGLVIEIDGVPYVATHTEWFNHSEMVIINAPSPQSGGPGVEYVFSHWSDGGNQSHNVSVSSPWINFTAYFTLVNTPPPPPGVSGCGLTGIQLKDVEITWSLSSDDGGGQNDVAFYLIYRGTSYSPSGSGYVLLDTVVAGVTSYLDVGGGHGDSTTYFYLICAVDGIGQITCDSQQASKFTQHLDSGMQLLSIPLVLSDTTILTVFQTVAFERVIYYDAMAGKRHNWRTFDTRKPYSDLKNVNHTMAVWVKVNSDSQLTVSGLVPKQTTIHLVVGWNFVGYSSFFDNTVGDALIGATYQTVETFDPADPPWFLKKLSDTDFMSAGEGYWIHVSNPFDWILIN